MTMLSRMYLGNGKREPHLFCVATKHGAAGLTAGHEGVARLVLAVRLVRRRCDLPRKLADCRESFGFSQASGSRQAREDIG
jgi:hypothetical protein